jgi:hypothetical protein
MPSTVTMALADYDDLRAQTSALRAEVERLKAAVKSMVEGDDIEKMRATMRLEFSGDIDRRSGEERRAMLALGTNRPTDIFEAVSIAYANGYYAGRAEATKENT